MIINKGPVYLTSFVIKDEDNQKINYINFGDAESTVIAIEPTVFVDKSFKSEAYQHESTQFYLTVYSVGDNNVIPFPSFYVRYLVELPHDELKKANIFKLKFKVQVDANGKVKSPSSEDPNYEEKIPIKSFYIRLSYANLDKDKSILREFNKFEQVLEQNKVFETVIPTQVIKNEE